MKKVLNNTLAGDNIASALMFISSFFVVQAFGYMINIRPVIDDIERLTAQENTQQERLIAEHHALRDLLAKKQAFENDLTQHQSQADFMSFHRTEPILADITEQGGLHGLQFTKLELGSEEHLENYQRSLVHFELQGEYRSIVNFVLSTDEKYANFVFEKVILKRSELKGRPVSMVAISYLYHPVVNKNADD